MLSTVFLTERDNLFRERSSTTAQLTEAPWNGLQDDSQKKIWKKSALLLLLLCPSSQRSFLHEHAVAGIGSLLKCVDGQPFPWWWPCPVLPPYLNAQWKVKITVKFSSKLNLKTAYSLSELQQDRWTPHCNSPNSPWQMPGKYISTVEVWMSTEHCCQTPLKKGPMSLSRYLVGWNTYQTHLTGRGWSHPPPQSNLILTHNQITSWLRCSSKPHRHLCCRQHEGGGMGVCFELLFLPSPAGDKGFFSSHKDSVFQSHRVSSDVLPPALLMPSQV